MADRDQLLDEIAAQLGEHAGRTAAYQLDALKAILRPFLAAWDAAAPYKIPGPYEIAMAFGAAAVAQQTGREPNIAAAMQQAWAAVPEFYRARDWYVNEFAPMRMGYAMSPAEGRTDEHEAGG